MADKATINSNMYQVVNFDPVTFQPASLKQQYYLPPSAGYLGAVKQGAGINIATDGTISATGGGAGVASLAVTSAGILRIGNIKFLAGTNTTIVDNGDNTFTWNATGGGGVSVNIVGDWSSGGTSKDQYTAPSVINAQGINLAIILTSGTTVVVSSVSVGGVSLTGTFTVTGTFPNFAVAITSANVPDAVQLAGGAISVQGTLDGANYSVSGGTLTTNPPNPYTATSIASFGVATAPFYTTSGVVSITGSDVGTNTSATLTLTNGATTESVTNFKNYTSTALFPFTGTTYTGSIIGTGTRGAGSSTISINQPIVGPTSYTPAFFVQTATAAVPVITTATTQTAGSQIGANITYPVATATTQYNWVATTRPIANVFLVTPFGNSQLLPDVTATQVLAGTTFNIFGWTGLTVSQASRLTIN